MKERKKDSNKSEEKARIGFFAGFQLRCKNPTNNEATKLEKHVLEKKWTFANEEIEWNGNEKKGEKKKSLCRNNQRRNRKWAVFEQLLRSLKILLKKRCCYFGS